MSEPKKDLFIREMIVLHITSTIAMLNNSLIKIFDLPFNVVLSPKRDHPDFKDFDNMFDAPETSEKNIQRDQRLSSK